VDPFQHRCRIFIEVGIAQVMKAIGRVDDMWFLRDWSAAMLAELTRTAKCRVQVQRNEGHAFDCTFVHHLDDTLSADIAGAMMPDVHIGLQCGGRDNAGGEMDGFEAV
jgi:hypothetical protein